jgi:hypothetical protein
MIQILCFPPKNSYFYFFPEKTEVPGFPGKKSGIPGKDGNLFVISRKLSGTPYCAQIYLKSIKASLKRL